MTSSRKLFCKLILASLCLVFVQLISANAAVNIGFEEEFGLAPDRSIPLKQLIPGTEDYFYFNCLNFQNEGKYAEVENMLKQWIKKYRYTQRVEEIRNRQALLTYSQDPDKSIKLIRDRLGLYFNHQRNKEKNSVQYPTSLRKDLISRSAFLRNALSTYSDLSGVENKAIESLIEYPLNPDQRRDLLKRMERPEGKNLPRLIVEDLNHKYSGGFGSIPIHNKLLLSQLEECRQLMPGLINQNNYVNEVISRLQPGQDENPEYDNKVRSAYLEKMWKFCKDLAPSFNSLKAHILYHILKLDMEQGKYDRSRFMEYLKLPRNVSYMNRSYLRRAENRRNNANLYSDFRRLTLMPPIGKDEELIKAFIEKFLLENDNFSEFENYINHNYLKKLCAETMILNNKGDLEKWYSWLSPTDVKRIKEKIELEFLPTNSSYLKTSDQVSLNVRVKNVKKLILKIYKLNILNYYRDKKAEVSTAVDLDGLVANEEKVFEYNLPDFVRHDETFSLPNLADRGVYVVELIGNGKSSRALIRKGQLFYVERKSTAGHILTVFDENGQNVNTATVWMNGNEFKPDEEGKITIPYSTKPARNKIIIRHGNFAAFHTFNHMPENYSLNGGFFIEREAMIEGEKAKVIYRPDFRINGLIADVNLLKNISLRIATTDLEGVSSSKDIRDLKLYNDKETTYEFKIPEKLTNISFSITAQIENLSLGKKQDLSFSRSFSINKICSTEKIEDFFIKKENNEYSALLLGRSGEPVVDKAINLEIKHRDFRRSLSLSLQTNEKGIISLGNLEEIEWINLTNSSGTQKKFYPVKNAHTTPSEIVSKAGSIIVVPFMGNEDLPAESQFSLYELKNGKYSADYREYANIRKGNIIVNDLPPGDFELFLKEEQKAISVKILKTDLSSEAVLSKTRFYDSVTPRQVQISSIKIDEKSKKAVVELVNTNQNTRLHFIATRFLPEFSVFENIGLFQHSSQIGKHRIPAISQYLSGRTISEEFRYILERKYSRIYPGNMLKRPGLLLNPWSIRKTDTSTRTAASGDDWKGRPQSDSMKDMGGSYGSQLERSTASLEDYSYIDFLTVPALLVENMKPDAGGKIEIDISKAAQLQHLHFIALDERGSVYRQTSTKSIEESYKDLRLQKAFDAKKNFTEQKIVSVLEAKKKFQIQDVRAAKFEMFDSLQSVYRLFSTITSDKKLTEFNFILNWPEMDEKAKLENYSKYSCHELNFFIFKKDKKFFNDIIKPYIANKRDKTFLDNWLLDKDLTEYLEPWKFNRLNIVEKILLGQKLKVISTSTRRHVEDLFDMIPPDVEKFNELFKTALKGNALDSDDSLGIQDALRQIRSAPIKPQSAFRSARANKMELNEIAEPREELMEAEGFASAAAPAPSARMLSPKSKRRFAEKKALLMSDEDDGAIAGFKSDARRRDKVRQLFKQLEKTEEWVENNYYQIPIEQQTGNLIKVNEFWKDYAGIENSHPFYSKNFAHAAGNFSEMMFALSVLDLPFKAEKHETALDKLVLSLTPGSNMILFHREIREAKSFEKSQSILTGQNFFARDDRYFYDRNQRFDKFVTEEFQTRRVYGCQIVLTNPTSSQKKVDVLIQIPQGSIPVDKSNYTRSIHMQIDPFSTKTHEYYFYFPFKGKFNHYPVQVSENEKLIAANKAFVFNVVDELTQVDKTSWPYISQNGSNKDVIDFLNKNNIERFDLNLAAFRLKDKTFFEDLYSLLKKRHKFHNTVWSYGIFHRNKEVIKEFLSFSNLAEQSGSTLNSELLVINPIERFKYQHKEYLPLINARSFKLGKKREILNQQLGLQYREFNNDLRYHPKLSAYDKLAATYYLLLQDRIEEASKLFSEIEPSEISEKMQFDYMKAWLAFSNQEPEKALKIAENYKNYPVNKWRNVFNDIISQVEEINGESAKITDTESRDQKQNLLAETQPNFEFEIDEKDIKIAYKNLEQVSVKFYSMDIELMFSRNPFVQSESTQFSIIQPNQTLTVKLNKDTENQIIKIPENLADKNLMIEIEGPGIIKSKSYYPNSMLIQMIENYGIVKVSSKTEKKPLAKVYVKVYSKMKNGQTTFYKDGYTDLRGKFDYASLSTNQLDGVEKFAILIMSETDGSLIKEVNPPVR